MKIILLLIVTTLLLAATVNARSLRDRVAEEESYLKAVIQNELAKLQMFSGVFRRLAGRQRGIGRLATGSLGVSSLGKPNYSFITRQQYTQNLKDHNLKLVEVPVKPNSAAESDFHLLQSGQKPKKFTFDDYPIEARAIMTMIYNGMNLHGGRGHTVTVGSNGEINVYESEGRYKHGEIQVPEFQKGEPVRAYMDKSPCKECTAWLIKQYHGKKVKPTLYITFMFGTVSDLQDLHKAGFQVCAMSMDDLKALFPEYSTDITAATEKNHSFIKGQETLVKNLLQAGFDPKHC